MRAAATGRQRKLQAVGASHARERLARAAARERPASATANVGGSASGVSVAAMSLVGRRCSSDATSSQARYLRGTRAGEAARGVAAHIDAIAAHIDAIAALVAGGVVTAARLVYCVRPLQASRAASRCLQLCPRATR